MRSYVVLQNSKKRNNWDGYKKGLLWKELAEIYHLLVIIMSTGSSSFAVKQKRMAPLYLEKNIKNSNIQSISM